MPFVRFVREGRDVKCLEGENLREIVLREGLQLYGLKGTLGNCGGYGQCITCFVAVFESAKTESDAISPPTEVESKKLKLKPVNWRLACQVLVSSSILVLTKPQSPPSNLEEILEVAVASDLPE